MRVALSFFHINRAKAPPALTNFKVDGLPNWNVSNLSSWLDFRMMYEQVFAPILRSIKIKTFLGNEPLDCSFDHSALR